MILGASFAVLDPATHPEALVVIVLVAVVLTAAVTAAVAATLAWRRRKGSKEIVGFLEEMRAGKVKRHLDVDARSPFAAIAESANRLGQDLDIRWAKAETAHEGFYALQEAARGYAVIATDSDGDLRALSPGAGRMFGWDEDAVIGRNASLLFDESAWKDLLPKLARKSLRERGVETRALMSRSDGSRFHARILVRVLRGAEADPSGFLMVVQDVSEQVKLESDLRSAEQRSRGMIEGLPDGAALIERGRIVYANPAMCGLLGIGADEASGLLLREKIATSHVLVVQDALARLEAGAHPGSIEESIVIQVAPSAAGREVRFVAASHAHEGRPAVLVVFRDETSERRLVRTLAAEEARLDALVDAWADGVVLVEDDASGSRIRLANRAFLRTFALEGRDLAGAPSDELEAVLRARGPEGVAAMDCLAAAGGGPTEGRYETDERALIFRALPIDGRLGGSRLRLLSVRDATGEHKAELARIEEVAQWRRRHETAVSSYATLREMHDDLEARRADAERLNAELRMLDNMKSDLLANVSHELQTPLVSIRGYTEMILKGRLGAINEEQKKGLALSMKNIDRLIAMIDGLLAFARTDREGMTLELSSFSLSSLLDETLALLAPRIEDKKLEVRKELEETGLSIRADRDKILQVFLNVVGNAVKYNRDGGSIDITARRGRPGFALVEIADSGVGIARDDLERVFDRFYRASSGEAPEEGTGIGLAIVRNILRLHGCVIRVTSEVGKGSVFSFTLPLAGEPAQAHDAETPAPKAPPPPPLPSAPPADRGPSPEPRRPAPAETRKAPEAASRPKLRIIRRS